ncbi:MAG: hypothetical protein WCO63_06910 [Bacteroidota bacterium]
MKRILLLAIFAFFAINAFSQSDLPLVKVSHDEYNNDTVRTFTLVNTDHDQSIKKLIEVWGAPVKNTPGNISWQNINIPGVGENISIELYDGILGMLPNKGLSFKTFRDASDKEQRIKNMTDNEHRITDIVFFNNMRKKIINSESTENAVMKFFNENLKKLN